MQVLKPNETVLIGGSKLIDGRFVADETSQRIAALVENVLTKIADSEDGWSTLHKDPSYGRLWQLACENSGQHGGGMPTLKSIDPGEAKIFFDLPTV
mgnify:CR=1 FL=1